MSHLVIEYSDRRDLPLEEVVALYRANGWSSADRPAELQGALRDCHGLVSAWSDGRLIGLGNAISDGHLVVYYPHLLVRPDFQRKGVGAEIMRRLTARYATFHQHMLVADREAIAFYSKSGFKRAGNTEPMWIYAGQEH